MGWQRVRNRQPLSHFVVYFGLVLFLCVKLKSAPFFPLQTLKRAHILALFLLLRSPTQTPTDKEVHFGG